MNDLQDRLAQRLDENYADLMARGGIIDGLDAADAIEAALRYLKTEHVYTGDQAEYLLKFQNPLEIFASVLRMRIGEDNGLPATLNIVFEERYALNARIYLHMYDLAAPDNPDLRKFVNVDVIAALGAIAGKVVVFYPKDFEYNKETLWKFANDDNPEHNGTRTG